MRYTDYRRGLEEDKTFLKARDELNLNFALGKAVVRGRINRGWSQTKLAKEVGTRQANISRIESGLANPTLKLMNKIAKALDITISFDGSFTVPRDDTSYTNLFTTAFPMTSQPTSQYVYVASAETILDEATKVIYE